MRDRSNTVSLMANVQRRVEVSILCKTALPATERLPMPLSGLDMTTARASDASVGWSYHLDSKTMYRREQQHSLAKEPSRVLLPANESFRIFQADTSTRTLRHGRNLSSFASNCLSRVT